ncbi:hypothetical protein WDW86_17950 [Bdellovibrionota bacterium FG-2]
MKNKKGLIRLGVVSVSVMVAYTIAIGVIGGCSKKADPAADVAASPSPSVSPEVAASPEVSPTPVIFTSDTFDRNPGASPSTLPSPALTDFGLGGIAKPYVMSPSASVWGITSNQAHVMAPVPGISGGLFIDTGFTTCTLISKLSSLPAATALAGFVVRAVSWESQLFFFADTGKGLTMPELGNTADQATGYKLVDVSAPSVLHMEDGRSTFAGVTPTAGDVIRLDVTPTQITATVTQATGSSYSHIYTNGTNATATMMGLASGDVTVMYDYMIIQDCQ